MIVKLLTEHHLEFLSLKGGCRGLSESTLVKMLHCWKYHAGAHLSLRSLFCLFWSGRSTQVLLYSVFLSVIAFTTPCQVLNHKVYSNFMNKRQGIEICPSTVKPVLGGLSKIDKTTFLI